MLVHDALSLFAQQSPDYNSSRNSAKKERINQMMKMEEEGDLIFDHYSVFGFKHCDEWVRYFLRKG